MEQQERDLVRRYMDGYRMYVELNGHVHEVLYASRWEGDIIPWIVAKDPALRFSSHRVHAHVVLCVSCKAEVGPGIKARAGFPIMDRCEACAVAELAGDIVQIERGTLK